MDSSKKFDNPSPELNANIFSKLAFTWLMGLFRKGLHNDLEVKDLYNTKTKDLSEPLGDELERNWNKEIARAKKKQRDPRLLTAIIHTFKRSYIFHGVLLFIQSVFIRIAQPIFMGKVIEHFNSNHLSTTPEAYTNAAILILLSIVSTLIMFHSLCGQQVVGMRIRVACCSLMYRKMLRLSHTAHGETATGQVVNLMSNDVSRFDQTPTYLHYLWIMPIQAVVMSYFMYETVGVAAFAGVAVITIQAVPLQGYLSRWTAHLRLRIAQRTDERVRLMNEIISGIQVIKMYAWEKPFQEVVRLARKLEIDVLSTTSYIRGFSLALMVYTERLSLYVTIVTYVLLGNELSGDKVFSMAQFFNIMQLFMAIFFPLAVSMGGEALVSVKRIEDFLLQEENVKLVKPILQNGYTDKERDGSISIKNGFAAWKPNQIVETLLDLNLNLKSGQLCAIVGQVGAGKSSILHLLLSELPLSTGSLYVGGTVSYCSQEPWLFASTVRNNILFGQPFEKQRYNEVVRACALLKDFEQFPHGDKTLVGDRGASLSGGQRARINLARAVYRRADIYLMDDPLSAVDTHVSKHLFEECMKEYLSTKTRILVTHQLQFIKEADLILVINNGRIEKQGTWSELSANGNTFEGIIQHNDEEQPEEEIIPPRQRLMSELSAHSASPEDEEDDPQETQELMEKGAMSSKVFFQYLRAGGSIYLLGFLLLSLIIAQVASSGADYWIRYWTNQVDEMKKNQFDDNVPDFSKLNNEFPNNGTVDFPENVTELISSISEIITTSPLITDITESILNMTSEDPLKTKRSLDISTISNATKNISVTVPQRSKREIDNNTLNTTTPLPLQYENENQQYFSQEMCIYIYSFCIAGSVILTTMRSLLFYKVIMNASINLHNTMFSNIIQSVMRFFDTNPSGRILNRFSKDMGAIDELLPRALLEAIQIFLVMSGILVLVALVNPYLILPMIVMGILFYIIRVIYLATAQDIKRLEGITKSPVFSHLSASMDGLITIRSCGAEELLQKEFDSHQDLHTSAWYLTVATSTAFGFFLDCVSIAFMACVTFSFIIFNNDDDTPSGNVGLAISQSMILTGMLQYGMRQTAEVLNQMTSVERVLQYTRLEKEGPFESLPGKKPPLTWPQQGKIIFEHLYLRYCATDPPVLKNLNIQIQPGSKVGIVGRTGAGKSSLIQALFKLAPLDGKIYIDEVATDSIGLKDLRTKISIIPQQPVLFSATLRHNLDPFETCDDASLWQALEEVELKEVAENLDYKVNEGGSNFSAGQRQLLCLARAIVRNNKVLVLDEATANVDPNTDALIQKTIRKKFATCTVLTIAHRLNTVMDSDKILVMDAGQMVEYDHPHLLLQTSDSYLSKMVAETGKNMEQKLRRIAEEAYIKKETLNNQQNSIQE